MEAAKTHRVAKNPRISLRSLADYMAASEVGRRSIVRGCKYQPIARVVQHNEAKQAVGRFIRSGAKAVDELRATVQRLRERMADTDFDRDVLDHNADYIDRFVRVQDRLSLPKADILAPGPTLRLEIAGIRLTAEIQFRLRRLTRTNKIKIGAGALRYAKGSPLREAVAEWQSAILHGLVSVTREEEEAEPELGLCLTIDAYSGTCTTAPTDSVRRFRNAEAACATIAEQWDQIGPPQTR